MSGMSAGGNEAPATRGQVVAMLELLATRMQWSAARPIISGTSLHVSRGWQETIHAAKEDAYSDAIWTAAYKTLSSVVGWHTYVGNKHVSFFDLRLQNEEDRTRVLKWAQQSALTDLTSVLRKRPFDILTAPTTNGELEPFKNPPPKLIAADYVGEKLYLQFFSTRSYTQRVPLDISTMSAAQQKVFEEYEELIGVKTKSVPCFDTVVVDTANELIEIRVDFQPGMTEDKETPAFARVVPDGHPKLLHLWPPKLLQAGRGNYACSGVGKCG